MPCRETNPLMLKLYFPPRCRLRWLIPGLLPAGLSLLAGASKAGKSWLCLWLCLQLARGGEIWGRPTQPQTVLYLCLEDTYARIQGRLFRLTEDSVPSRLYFQTGSCAIGDGLELQIEKFLSQHPETGLVVIDTLQKVRTADPNNGAYASDYQDMSALKSLADRRDIGLLLVHHLRKQGASDPFQQISGSNGLMGAADTIWLLQRQRMSDTARLLVTGRDMDSCTLHLQTRDCIWQLLEEETAEEQVRKAVPDYLWRAADFVRRAGSCPMEAGKIRFPAPKNIPNSILATSSRCRNVSCCILFPPAAHSAPPRQMRRGAAGQSSFFSFLSFFSLSLRSFEGSALSPSSRSSSAAGSG